MPTVISLQFAQDCGLGRNKDSRGKILQVANHTGATAHGPWRPSGDLALAPQFCTSPCLHSHSDLLLVCLGKCMAARCPRIPHYRVPLQVGKKRLESAVATKAFGDQEYTLASIIDANFLA